MVSFNDIVAKQRGKQLKKNEVDVDKVAVKLDEISTMLWELKSSLSIIGEPTYSREAEGMCATLMNWMKELKEKYPDELYWVV